MPDPLSWNNLDMQEGIVQLPVDAIGLVPHKPPMLLISRLVEVKEESSISEVEVTENTIFVGENGRLDDVSYIEIIAQAMAAQDGFKNMGNRDHKRKGFLLGVKNLKIIGNAHIGDKLCVYIYKVAKYGEFGIIKGEVFKGKELIARGEIKVWLSEK